MIETGTCPECGQLACEHRVVASVVPAGNRDRYVRVYRPAQTCAACGLGATSGPGAKGAVMLWEMSDQSTSWLHASCAAAARATAPALPPKQVVPDLFKP